MWICKSCIQIKKLFCLKTDVDCLYLYYLCTIREKEKSEQSEEVKSTVESVTASLSAAFQLPEDDSLKVNRDIEDIFFKAVR